LSESNHPVLVPSARSHAPETRRRPARRRARPRRRFATETSPPSFRWRRLRQGAGTRAWRWLWPRRRSGGVTPV